MPFKSSSQRAKFYAMEARGELPKGTAQRWEDETPPGKLPKRLKPKKKSIPASQFYKEMGW